MSHKNPTQVETIGDSWMGVCNLVEDQVLRLLERFSGLGMWKGGLQMYGGQGPLMGDSVQRHQA